MLKKSLIAYILLTLIGVGSLWSQENNFANYNIEYGLSSSFTRGITQDKHGYMWVATAGGGINKFNGLKFQSYKKKHGLKSNIVFNVQSDSEGYLWALTDSSLVKMKGSEVVFVEIDSSATDQQYLLFLDASDNAWVATGKGGIYKIGDNSRQYYDSLQGFTKSHVTDIFERDDGRLVFATTGGLFTYSDSRFKPFEIHGITDERVKMFFEDNKGDLWLGTSQGLKHQSFGSKILTEFPNSDALKDRSILSIVQDTEGKIWMGTTRGVVSFHEGRFEKFDEAEGFTNNPVIKVYVDNHGSVWFCTWGFGVFKYHKTSFISYNKSFGLNHHIIKAILVDDDENIWFGLHANGIDKYDGEAITNYSVESGHLPHNKISAIIEDHSGVLWFGTRGGGLLKLSDGAFDVYNDQNSELIGNDVYTIFEDSKHNVWVGTVQGLSIYTNGSFKSYSKQKYPNSSTSEGHDFPIMSITEIPDGRVLIASTSGLYTIEKDSLIAYKPEANLSNYSIHSVVVKENILWIGTWGSGIVRIDLNTLEQEFITEENGLDSDLIHSLKFDEYNDLWVGSTLGLSKITFTDESQIERIRKYNPNDGFYGKSISNDRSIYLTETGTVWIGTLNGAYKYVRENDASNKQPPLTHITSIGLFNTTYDWSSRGASRSWFNLPDDLDLEYDENHLTFNFIGLSYNDPENVSYSFKLDNFDTDWSPPTHNKFATYSNLPPGTYTFNVKAANGEGVWNTATASYTLSILPAFWQTWWFYALCFLSTMGLIGFLWNNYKTRTELSKRLSVNEAKELAIVETRKKMALEFQHEIGNKLASILVSSNVLQKKVEISNNGAMSFARRIEANSRSLFDDVKDFIWTIDPKNDNLAELYNYIKEYGEIRFKGNSQFFSNVNQMTMKSDLLDSNLNRQIVWIFKKIVNMTSSDDSCKYASLNIKQHSDYFEISYCFDSNRGIFENTDLVMEIEKRAQKVKSQVNLGVCLSDPKLQQISFISHRASNGTTQDKY